VISVAKQLCWNEHMQQSALDSMTASLAPRTARVLRSDACRVASCGPVA